MGETTKIEWADATWNPWQGCRKVSPGCQNCYAERDFTRWGKDFSVVRRSATTFNAPLKWNSPKRIFTCSFSDFFIEDADAWRDEAWEIIRRTPQHTYLILTKRPERIEEHLPKTCFVCGKNGNGHFHQVWPNEVGHPFVGWWMGMVGTGGPWPNVWLGTSVEMQLYAKERIPLLTCVPAKGHFLSAEPLLGPLNFDPDFPEGGSSEDWDPYLLNDIEWVIAGGESLGPEQRRMKPEWARSIRDQCRAAGVPFFLKQLGGNRKCSCHGAWGCRELDGQTYDEMPEI